MRLPVVASGWVLLAQSTYLAMTDIAYLIHTCIPPNLTSQSPHGLDYPAKTTCNQPKDVVYLNTINLVLQGPCGRGTGHKAS